MTEPTSPDGLDVAALQAEVAQLRELLQLLTGPSPARDDGPADFEEWRVTGLPGGGYPRYDFTWSLERGPVADRADPEAAARRFVEPGRLHWDQGPVLHHRRVTRTAWDPPVEGPTP